MIKLLDIIEEGTLILTPDERQQVEAMIPVIIDLIKKPIPTGGNVWNAGKISYVYADGEIGEATIGIGDIIGDARGQFRTYDPQNRTDNWIIINQKEFKKYFPSSYSFQNIDQKITKTLTGDENTGIERLRQVFKHELIHAKDPAVNHLPSNQPYDSSNEKIYFESWLEFQTFTGQFFESLISGTDRILNGVNNAGDIKRIESALSNILRYFAGKTKTINIETKEFIDGTGSKNIFQKIFSFLNSIISSGNNYSMSEYLFFLNKIKQYNPEGYKEFLKDLYKTIKTIEEKVNSTSPMKIKVQEMKQNINEVKRMQQLAGLLTEAEEEQVGDASSKLASVFKTQDVSSFVDQFKAIASDPKVQAILKAGTTDGKPEDEKVTYSKGNIAVKGLLPTQNEIGFDQSIANILTDQYGSLKSILDGNANVGGPIVTYNGKYVIDGHHRWSQVYAANPNASMENLDIKGDLPPTEILKLVHAAIAAKVGKVPSADPKGINILDGISEKQVLDAVNSKLADSAKTIWAENGQKDNNAIAKYIYNNLKQLINKNKPVAGAPGRKDMPQTDVDGDATGKLSLLQKGMINFKDPKSSDIKNDQSVKEMKRLQQLAGILNEEEEATDAEIDKAMQAGLSALKDTSSLDEIKDEDQPKQLNEEPVTLIASALLAAPKILSWIGKVVGYLASPFTGENENSVSKKIEHFAHKWEGLYIKGIIFMIKFTKFGKQLWLLPNNKVDDQKLVALAKIIYGVILAIAMGNAIGTVLSSASPALKAIEGALGGVKAVEIAQIASKIKRQI
jgi:hypothetical protein